MGITKLTIELPEDTIEKLQLLKDNFKRNKGVIISESTLIQTIIAKEFMQEITPFDLKKYYENKEQS